jgi:hypothetical protein
MQQIELPMREDPRRSPRVGRNGTARIYTRSLLASTSNPSNAARSSLTNAAARARIVRLAPAGPAALWRAALSDLGNRNANVINGSVDFSFFGFVAVAAFVLGAVALALVDFLGVFALEGFVSVAVAFWVVSDMSVLLAGARPAVESTAAH